MKVVISNSKIEYTEKQEKFIRDNAEKMTLPALSTFSGLTVHHLKKLIPYFGIKRKKEATGYDKSLYNNGDFFVVESRHDWVTGLN
jgi:hypothetical protein